LVSMNRGSPGGLYAKALFTEDDDMDAEFERAAAEFEAEESSKHNPIMSQADTGTPTITVEQSVDYLNQTLPGLGITNAIRLDGLDANDAASICNCLHTLLYQRQRDQEYRKASEEQLARLRSDLQSNEQARERLESKLETRERENGSHMIKERQIKQSHDEAMRKVNNEKETLTKTNAGLQRKHSQMQHELKRKELELQKVSDRLGMLLSDKKKAEAKANVELDKALKRSTAAPVAASVPPGARRGKVDDEMYKMIVSAYEAKQKELLQENADLKKSMSALQGEHRDLVNARSSYTPPSAVTEMLKQSEGAMCRTITSQMHAINRRVQQVMKAHEGAAAMVDTPLENQMQNHVADLLQYMTEQEELMSAAVLGLEKSSQESSSLKTQVEKLNREVENARATRNDAQHSLQAVVKDREDLAHQLKEQKVAYEDALRAIKLLEKEYEDQHKKLGVTKEKLARATTASSELAGDVCSLRDRKTQINKERQELDMARREVEELKQSLEQSQSKLTEGFNDLAQKRIEVLADIEKENARLAKSWDQVRAARKEIEQQQERLVKAWDQVEGARLGAGLPVSGEKQNSQSLAARIPPSPGSSPKQVLVNLETPASPKLPARSPRKGGMVTPEAHGKIFDPLATGKTPKGATHHAGIAMKTQQVVVIDDKTWTPSSSDAKYKGLLSSQWNAKATELKNSKPSARTSSPRALK